MFIAVSRDQLIPLLLSGQGDVVAANLTITPSRLRQVDFVRPVASGVQEPVPARRPKVWFDNVERLVAERIGRETVQYVSNIYKYYIAYTLVQEDVARNLEKSGAASLH